ncbi:MAG TPA: NFACT RNA binding domain-containing protein [Spirochaetota bacterium]|nr:NFACT RNA binding domain-containing protein [Spirochaetota bacterium]HOS33706.1 NFACT RNA binding domain-containing protein [Spirochaetota bacterium]HOS55202.1 NFACT RNA binding domain-containing protein [Spirochaetota bacterium]HPK61434.1 NFACT RNA binding domain-containing protein [Spirochaetota bacterium]HQF78555.1 NFACT RNA binding domain-containing protein [Spirochaetota bacterium]
MSLNCIEIEEVVATFPKPGIVKKFGQKDSDSLFINYQIPDGETLNLIINVANGYNYICLLGEQSPESRSLKFSQYLNSKFLRSKIENIYQLNLSRIVAVELIYDSKRYYIAARMWGTGGNILLLDENFVIIESLKRYPKRGEWIGEKLDISLYKSNRTDFYVRDEFKKDINNSIFSYYNRAIEEAEALNLRKNLLNIITNEIKRINELISKNESGEYENADKYLYIGESLKANICNIKDFSDNAEIFDYNTNSNIKVALDKNLTAVENIQKYFTKYRKLKDGKIFRDEQNRSLKSKLEKFDALLSEIEQHPDPERLREIKKSLNLTKAGNDDKSSINIRSFARIFNLANNCKAYVSKSAKDADNLLKLVAKGNDYWFHSRDYAGSHVVVKTEKGKELSERTKIEAAHLAVFYSKAKNALDGDVYFTQIKYLHKPNANVKGLVFPTREKNIKVRMEKKILDSILSNADS